MLLKSDFDVQRTHLKLVKFLITSNSLDPYSSFQLALPARNVKKDPNVWLDGARPCFQRQYEFCELKNLTNSNPNGIFSGLDKVSSSAKTHCEISRVNEP